VFIWDNDASDIPGNVLAITTNVNPGTIATWPNFTRVEVPLEFPAYPTGSWWAGFCLVGNRWDYPVYCIGANQSDEPGQGRPFTNIAPWGDGYPTGWHSVDEIWGTTANLGIGILAHTLQPAATPAPTPAGQLASWGRIKDLYR
jgi:hypothetical protein